MKKFILLGLLSLFLGIVVTGQVRKIREIEDIEDDISAKLYYSELTLYDLPCHELKGVELMVTPYYNYLIEELLKEPPKQQMFTVLSGTQFPLIFKLKSYSEVKPKAVIYGKSEEKLYGQFYTKPEKLYGKIFSLKYIGFSSKSIEFEDQDQRGCYYLMLSRGTWNREAPEKISDFIDLPRFNSLFYNYSYARAMKRIYLTNAKDKKERLYVCSKANDDLSVNVKTNKYTSVLKDEQYYLSDMVLVETDEKLILSAVLTKGEEAIFFPFKEEFFEGSAESYFKNIVEIEAEEQKAATQKQAQIDRLAAAEQRRNSLKAKYGSQLAQRIISKELALDMTTEMCLAAWGAPNDKHRTVTKTKTTEIWEYPHDRLIFENDKLISIEQTSLLKVNR